MVKKDIELEDVKVTFGTAGKVVAAALLIITTFAGGASYVWGIDNRTKETETRVSSIEQRDEQQDKQITELLQNQKVNNAILERVEKKLDALSQKLDRR